MQQSHLRLEGYYVREFSFAIQNRMDEHVPIALPIIAHPYPSKPYEPPSLNTNAEATLENSRQDPHRFRVSLVVASEQSDEGEYPYRFRLNIVGYFKIAEGLSEELTTMYLTSAAPSLLYSTAREYIAAATGRGPFPAAVIPIGAIPPSKISPEFFETLRASEAKPAPVKSSKRKPAAKKGKQKKSRRKVSAKK